MKRSLLLGLAVLAGCQQPPEAAAIDRNAAMIQDSLEQQAANMEAMANNAVDPGVSEALKNAADRLEDDKKTVGNAADAARDELKRR